MVLLWLCLQSIYFLKKLYSNRKFLYIQLSTCHCPYSKSSWRFHTLIKCSTETNLCKPSCLLVVLTSANMFLLLFPMPEGKASSTTPLPWAVHPRESLHLVSFASHLLFCEWSQSHSQALLSYWGNRLVCFDHPLGVSDEFFLKNALPVKTFHSIPFASHDVYLNKDHKKDF